MERQYIGARYVPKFFENPNTSNAEWLAGVAYEALTIVTYAGNSYTSKKPVPAGIGAPSTSTEYWVSTGIYNEQVESLRREVAGLSDDVSGLSDDITELSERVDNINDHKYIFITDSYGNYTDSENRNFIQEAARLLGITNYFDFHRGSAGFGREGDLNILKVLQDSESVITDKTSITDIFVFAGANDQDQGHAEIRGGIYNFCNYVKTNYPKAHIYIGFVTKSFDMQFYNGFYKVIDCYSKCGKFGASYLPGSEMIMQYNKLFRSDHVHPTTEAVDSIADYVTDLILSHSCNVAYTQILHPFIIGTNTVSAEIYEQSAYVTFNNGKTAIRSGQGGNGLTFNCNIPSIGNNYFIDFLYLDQVFCPPIYGNSNCVLVSVQVTCTEGTIQCMGVMSMRTDSLADNSIKLNLFLFPHDTITNATRISICVDWTLDV